jgi:hypothetical protein
MMRAVNEDVFFIITIITHISHTHTQQRETQNTRRQKDDTKNYNTVRSQSLLNCGCNILLRNVCIYDFLLLDIASAL